MYQCLMAAPEKETTKFALSWLSMRSTRKCFGSRHLDTLTNLQSNIEVIAPWRLPAFIERFKLVQSIFPSLRLAS